MPTYPASEARNHIGSYIQFLFYPGWEDPETMSGWLHGVSETEPGDQDRKTYLHISDAKKLPRGEDKHSIGGYAIHRGDTFEVVKK